MKPGVPTPSVAMERDADLLEALRAGDRRAVLEGLMQRYRQKVLHLAFSILRDPELAEDLSQTVFVKAWQALPKFDGRAALGTWIYAITRNTCLMEIRRRKPVVSMDDPDSSVAVAVEIATATGPAADPERDNLLRMVDRLPANQQQAVRLFYLEDRSYETVAELMGMPLGTVKNLLHRARKQLMQHARSEEDMAA
jgi:RNA polymerase sigma-70 factor (ECF subfamily)